MRGQKRVEDARKRAYDPRIHRLRKRLLRRWMDCRVKPGNDGSLVSASPVLTGELRRNTMPYRAARRGGTFRLPREKPGAPMNSVRPSHLLPTYARVDLAFE